MVRVCHLLRTQFLKWHSLYNHAYVIAHSSLTYGYVISESKLVKYETKVFFYLNALQYQKDVLTTCAFFHSSLSQDAASVPQDLMYWSLCSVYILKWRD